MIKLLLDKLTYKPEPLRLYSAGMSDVGLARKRNEDNLFIDEKLRLFMVADGMGGHEDGEIASKLAIQTISRQVEQFNLANGAHSYRQNTEAIPSLLQHAIEEANNLVHGNNIARGLSESRGMGTTVSGLWIGPSANDYQFHLYIFNVGDSRIYSYTDSILQQLSTDHSHYQLWLDRGKEGPEPGHNSIYKAIGPWQRVIAEQNTYPITNNTLYLLCSDGLSSMLDDMSIRTILYKHRHDSLETMTEQLVNAANNAGGKDNISVIIVRPGFFS
jgi:protein phosphatase